MATLESRNHPDETLLLVLGERRDPKDRVTWYLRSPKPTPKHQPSDTMGKSKRTTYLGASPGNGKSTGQTQEHNATVTRDKLQRRLRQRDTLLKPVFWKGQLRHPTGS